MHRHRRRRRGSGFSATVYTAFGTVHVQAQSRTELKRSVRRVARGNTVTGVSEINLKTRERM